MAAPDHTALARLSVPADDTFALSPRRVFPFLHTWGELRLHGISLSPAMVATAIRGSRA